MRRIVIEIPDMVGDPEQESPLRQKLPALARLAETGTLFKIAPMPRIETPEALYLGLGPAEAQMRQGPLTVSALGADPPERSTHFHLSLMTSDDGRAGQPGYLPSPEDLAAIWTAAKRLDTSVLTLVKGEGLDHGLVWEALGDLGTTPASEVDGKPIASVLPEGDGERLLRRLIDDSVNLLSELELNRRRQEEGLPPFNLLWPWGQGTRRPVPNLALRRGEPAMVESGSLRLAGLTRLAGYRHEDRSSFGRGLNTRFEAIAQRALARPITIMLIEAFREIRQSGDDGTGADRIEELAWLARELDIRLLQPIVDRLSRIGPQDEPVRVSILAPSSAPDRIGLGLVASSGAGDDNWRPFDERSLAERALPVCDLAEQVVAGVVR